MQEFKDILYAIYALQPQRKLQRLHLILPELATELFGVYCFTLLENNNRQLWQVYLVCFISSAIFQLFNYQPCFTNIPENIKYVILSHFV